MSHRGHRELLSDVFYSFIRQIFGVPFRLSGRPIVLGREQVPRAGPFILAANHQSPVDVPLLIILGLLMVPALVFCLEAQST